MRQRNTERKFKMEDGGRVNPIREPSSKLLHLVHNVIKHAHLKHRSVQNGLDRVKKCEGQGDGKVSLPHSLTQPASQ